MNIREYLTSYGARIASVAFAVVLWFNVVTNATYSSRITLPVHYTSPSEGFMIAGDLPGEIEVLLSGTGKNLFVYNLSGVFRKDRRFVLVNVAGLPKGINQVTLENTSIHLEAYDGLTVVTFINPAHGVLRVPVDRIATRSVRVDSDSIAGYRVDKNAVLMAAPRPDPAIVVITGAEDSVDVMSRAPLAPLDGVRVTTKDTLFTADVATPGFVTAEPSKVSLVFRVEALAVRDIDSVPVTLAGFPRSGRPAFSPRTVKVRIQGPESIVLGMDEKSVAAAIPYTLYREHAASGDSLITPSVTTPRGTTMVEVVPGAITVTLPRSKK